MMLDEQLVIIPPIGEGPADLHRTIRHPAVRSQQFMLRCLHSDRRKRRRVNLTVGAAAIKVQDGLADACPECLPDWDDEKIKSIIQQGRP